MAVTRFVALIALLALPGVRYAARAAEPAGAGEWPPVWVYGDVPAWDIADEGLPFRLTGAWPSPLDPLARFLMTAETRWTASVGYVRVYNSYDGATGNFKNPGGNAVLASVAREFRWRLPGPAVAGIPTLLIEFGVNVASHRFPADGTQATLLVVSGLEWALTDSGTDPEWTLALVWSHFSNANLFSRNAGYDGLALRLGRRLRF